jgi:CIC family chloride channel protein
LSQESRGNAPRPGIGEVSSAGRWIALSSLIGVLGGVVAVAFHWLTDVLRELSLGATLGLHHEGLSGLGNASLWILVIPTVGGVLVGWLTQRLAPEAEGHGTEQLVRSFHQQKGAVRRRVVPVKALCSAISIGTGGSAGQEGPVAQIGSGVGSMVADSFELGDRERRILLLSGASAGVGALFTAPLGGALFAPEVLYRKSEFEGEAIVPCIISSIVAYTTFTSITGKTRAIDMDPALLESLSFGGFLELPLYLGLALFVAAVGWFWVTFFKGTTKAFGKLKRWPLPARAGLGGLGLGVLALSLAPLAGTHGVLFGGYELMRSSVAAELGLWTLLLLIPAKILATSLTLGSGGSGGVFAPSLAIGALCGAAIGTMGELLLPERQLTSAFALVGMGAFFAGVAKTPIAAILMVCEMTGSYDLLAPLMLVSVVHLMLAQRWSIYETQVDGLVDSPAHAGDFVVDVLEELKVSDLVDPELGVTTVHQNATLREALDIVSKDQASYFPVLDDDQRLVGIFSLTDIRRIFLEADVHNLVIVRDFMVEGVVTVELGDNLNVALQRLNELTVHEIPVVAADDPGRVVGMLSRNRLGAAYHQRLRELRRRSG